MSHIDQALRVSETATGTPAVNPSPKTGSAPLNQYPHEGPSADKTPSEVQEGRKDATTAFESEGTEPQRPADPPPVRAVRATTLRDDADLRARLVTGGSSTVSLEQYRRLAAVLHEEQAERHLKTVMITSAVPHEGKTLTVVNLALTVSGSFGRRVLIIDGDLRAPSVHSLLGIRNGRGLNEVLHEAGNELPIVELSDRLSVLTAGHPGPTPLAGLTSARMAELLDECAANFDWVFIDTSPVGVLPDAQVLARLVGGVLFVIGANSTPAAAVERAIAQIGPDSIIGTVLNRVDDRRIHEAGYYNKYGYYSPHRKT